jgi:hypothetical protein
MELAENRVQWWVLMVAMLLGSYTCVCFLQGLSPYFEFCCFQIELYCELKYTHFVVARLLIVIQTFLL